MMPFGCVIGLFRVYLSRGDPRSGRDDMMAGQAGDDMMSNQAGDDMMAGQAGDDEMAGQAGHDEL